VGNTDVLYILLHGTGSIGMERVAADRNRASEDKERQDRLKRALGAPEVADPIPASVWKAYTPDALAQNLANEGLPLGHQVIELLACGAGLQDDPQSRNHEVTQRTRAVAGFFEEDLGQAHGQTFVNRLKLVRGRVQSAREEVQQVHRRIDDMPNLARSFGDRFCEALRQLGYDHVRVHAYRGDVKVGQGHDSPGRAPAPFIVESTYLVGRKETYNPNDDGVRVTYPPALG
jgi:hypothetical protein